MRLRSVILASAVALLLAVSSQARAGNLIIDGNFSNPSLGGSWTLLNGTSNVTGFVNNNGDNIEVGYSPIYGLPCASASCQNLEVNANTFDSVSVTVNGLTVGKTYDVSWAYGGRTSGGPDALVVTFGNSFLAYDTGSIGVWTPNSFDVLATSASEVLTFASVVTNGLPSYGNEITNVSLSAVPLPGGLSLFGAGLVGVGVIAWKKKKPA